MARSEVAASPVRINHRESASPGPEEALPQQADGFDWVEEITISGLSDGMAALSIMPEGAGYLGEAQNVKQKLIWLTNLPISRCYFERDAPASPVDGRYWNGFSRSTTDCPVK